MSFREPWCAWQLCIRVAHGSRAEGARAHVRAHVRAHAPPRAHTRAHTCHTRTQKYTRTHAQACTHARTHSQLDDFLGLSPESSRWSTPRLKALAAEVCADIQNCLNPIRLLQLIHREQQEASANGGAADHCAQAGHAGLFCLSSWLCPHIGRDAEVGVYSNSSIGRVYQLAAQRMPSLLLVAAMGEELVVQSMQVPPVQRRSGSTVDRSHVSRWSRIPDTRVGEASRPWGRPCRSSWRAGHKPRRR